MALDAIHAGYATGCAHTGGGVPSTSVLIVIVTGVEMSWIWMFAHIGQITDPNIVI